MDNTRAHVIVDGRVQGVFFRATARDMARKLGINGWVKNRMDGKVELVLEGEENAVKRMVEWCCRGPSGAVVTNVDLNWESFEGEFKSFSIRY